MKAQRLPRFLFFLVIFVSFLDIYPDLSWSLDKESAPAQTLAAEKLFKDGKYQETVVLLSKNIEVLDGAGFKLLGQSYSELKNPALAIKNYNLAISKNPKDAEAKTLLGLEYLKSNKDREAMTALKEALDIDPTYEKAYLTIEKIYVKKNNKYELRILYTDMLEKIGPKPEYYARLCELHTQSGIYDLAKQFCRKGIELAKEKEPRNYVYLAIALKDSGEIDEAKSLFKRAAENFPKSEEAQMGYAQFLEEQKNYMDSIRLYKSATLANPSSVKAWVGYAMASFEVQKYQEALDGIREACKWKPTSSAYVRKMMGQLMIQKQDSWYKKFDKLAEECSSLYQQKTK